MSLPPLKSRLCGRTGCGAVAVKRPVLLLRAPEVYEPCPPIRAVLGFGLCARCADAVTASDLVTDAGWALLVRGVRAAGKVDPVRSRTEVACEWLT